MTLPPPEVPSAIPHFIIAYALGVLGSAVGVISWFVIVITGDSPKASPTSR